MQSGGTEDERQLQQQPANIESRAKKIRSVDVKPARRKRGAFCTTTILNCWKQAPLHSLPARRFLSGRQANFLDFDPDAASNIER